MTVTIEPAHLAEVHRVLADHLPQGIEVRVFGSRAHKEGDSSRVRKWSDLDLVLDGGVPLDWSIMGDLAEAFDEALLPWKVDLVDRRAVSERFASIVDSTSVPLPARQQA